jgi:hypothetical protein
VRILAKFDKEWKFFGCFFQPSHAIDEVYVTGLLELHATRNISLCYTISPNYTDPRKDRQE